MQRSSTNFTIQLFEYLKSLDITDEYSFLKYYQNIVRKYINDPHINSRGLLVYHTMGMGKTITAIASSLESIETRQPIILLTKSLQANFRDSIKKYIQWRSKNDKDYSLGQMDDVGLTHYIESKFAFVSMNASNMIKQLANAVSFDRELDTKMGQVVATGSLDNKMLIVDEAHNLFRAITNGSKNGIELYDMVMKAKNLKIIFLTGTPISNDPFELVPCFNMLGGSERVLPDSFADFYKAFVDTEHNVIKNKNKFQNRILGLVSYITHTSKPGAAVNKVITTSPIEFPKQLSTRIEYVPMDSEQYVIYQLARDKELEEAKRSGSTRFRVADVPSLMKPKTGASSSYRVKSRQLSNYCPPEKFRDKKFSSINIAAIPEKDVTAPKLRAVLKNVTSTPGLGLVYSQFVGVGGLGILARFLEINGWKRYITKFEKNTEASLKVILSEDAENIVVENAEDVINTENIVDAESIIEKKNIEKVVNAAITGANASANDTGGNHQITCTIDNCSRIEAKQMPIVRDNVSIRTMTLSDIDDIRAIDTAKHINKNKNYANVLSDTIVAVIENSIGNTSHNVIGYMTVVAKDGEAHINNISIDARYKSHGIQDLLLHYIMEKYKIINARLNKQCPYYNEDLQFYMMHKFLVYDCESTHTCLQYNIQRHEGASRSHDMHIGSYLDNIDKQVMPQCHNISEKTIRIRIDNKIFSKMLKSDNNVLLGDSIKYSNIMCNDTIILESPIASLKTKVIDARHYPIADDMRKLERGIIIDSGKLSKRNVVAIDTLKYKFGSAHSGCSGTKSNIYGGDTLYNVIEMTKQQAAIIHIKDDMLKLPYIARIILSDDQSSEIISYYTALQTESCIQILTVHVNDKYNDNFFQIIEAILIDLYMIASFSQVNTINYPVAKYNTDLRRFLESHHYIMDKESNDFWLMKLSATEITGASVGRSYTYAIISGAVSVEMRDEIVTAFNSDDNKHGGIIDLLLVSATGAEGLDLKNIRHVHVLEPYWNYSRIAQIIARGVRNDSHIALPADEKNVQPFIYLAVPPTELTTGKNGNNADSAAITTDVELYDDSVKNQIMIESFTTALKEVAIECMLNGESYCRVCNPDNGVLFTNDIVSDMRAFDPCQPVKETKITAQEILVDGVTYYYITSDGVYGYKVFEYDKTVAGYKEMSEDASLFSQIIEAIAAHNNENDKNNKK